MTTPDTLAEQGLTTAEAAARLKEHGSNVVEREQTDGLPALALVTDPVDPDAIARPPRKQDEPMLARAQWTLIGFTGLLEAISRSRTAPWRWVSA